MRTFGKDGSIVLDYTCRPVGEFEDYLKVLNADAKLINTVCKFSGDVTTMIKMIECEVLHGPPQAVIYWAENLNECQKIEANFKKNKEEYGRINK